VTSLRCFIGPEGDITTCAPSHAKRLELAQPILTLHEMAAMKIINAKKWKAKVGFEGFL
jgi:glutamate synthase (NADPH/NADH)